MKAQFHRILERDGETVSFHIDGQHFSARKGDLLLTAILLHRGSVRRFEFGDAMRAGFCLMGGCQDCWVTLDDGQRVRACSTPVEPGMHVIIDGDKA